MDTELSLALLVTLVLLLGFLRPMRPYEPPIVVVVPQHSSLERSTGCLPLLLFAALILLLMFVTGS